ncbi:MAG: hypothetical protein CMN33_07135 [Saprospirales bacterium]|nr:hypothetical protein [Saprospirales bacterium]|tara:strand:+ start:6411 stop:6644 length:234 start_codon:yes stop_codon:yes gene_type:complete
MSHPLLEDLTVLSEADLQERLSSISTKYWQTQNPDVRSQMLVIIDELKYELALRRSKPVENIDDDGDNSLDNLINIS